MTVCWRYLTGTLIAYALLSPSEAKGFFIVTWGETISHVDDISVPGQINHDGNKVGYKYNHFGVFWIDLWTWGGTHCVYKGERYQPITSADAARLIGKDEADLGKPFLYRFPLGLLILGGFGALIVGLAILDKIQARGEKAKVAQLLDDPVYQRALEMASVPSDQDEGGGAAFEAGVGYLTESGVAPRDALRNLKLLIGHSALGGASDSLDPVSFEPQMPEVEDYPPEHLEKLFTEARRMSAGKSTGNAVPVAAQPSETESTGPSVVVVTPGGILMPFAIATGSVPPEVLANGETILPSNPRRRIVVISYTNVPALLQDPDACIPFRGFLLNFACLGHVVWVFEGHASRLEAGCRGADILLIDSGMLPHLQEDWQDVAAGVMRGKELWIHNRENYSLAKTKVGTVKILGGGAMWTFSEKPEVLGGGGGPPSDEEKAKTEKAKSPNRRPDATVPGDQTASRPGEEAATANRLTCPSCGARLKTAGPMPAGKRIKCPKCDKPFVV